MEAYVPQMEGEFYKGEIIGKSESIKEIRHQIELAVNLEEPVLIEGETGTGKDLVAKAIHNQSPRREGPYIARNCACIPPTLMESEFFGYKRGAFTGATMDRQGLFEAAHKGILFLDEICDLELSLQAKFLRVIEDGEVCRLGTTTSRKVDVRLITASAKDLEQEVKVNRFRIELYYRLKVIKIWIPPLRQRKKDIPLLAHYFLEKYGKIKGIKGFTKKAMGFLSQQKWLGNIRELENVIKRAVVFTEEGNLITLKEVIEPQRPNPSYENPSLREIREEFEKQAILQTLLKHNFSVTKAAKSLKITPMGLYKKMKKYNIKRE